MSIGIYLSFPFSKTPIKNLDWGKYPYQRRTALLYYLNSLIREIESSPYQNHSTASLLFGAGDWGLAPEEYLLEIKSCLQKKFKVNRNCEVTIECSLGSLNVRKLKNFQKTGVNRISLNLFDSHSRNLKGAVSEFKKLGIQNFNLDLYFGKPGQNLIGWKKELRRRVSLDPTHLSLHSFGRPKERQQLKPELYFCALDLLSERGYKQYEVCHFCRPGFKSRQNLLYFKRANYLGYGAGAASLWNETRWKNVGHPRVYTKLINSNRNAASFREKLDRSSRIQEVIYFSLRQTPGLNLKKLKEVFGNDLYEAQRPLLDGLIKNGYLSLKRNRLCLTKEGFLIADDLISKIISQEFYLTGSRRKL